MNNNAIARYRTFRESINAKICKIYKEDAKRSHSTFKLAHVTMNSSE